MTSEHALPWDDNYRWAGFRETLRELPTLRHTGEAGIRAKTVDELRWRHWVVACAVELAIVDVPRDRVDLVECGVADGITAFVAATETARLVTSDTWTIHLYDAWDAMAEHLLLPSERQQAGRYGSLDLEAARENLARFDARCQFHVGYLPETFDEPDHALPDCIVFAHVDLNASMTTRACCERIWPRLARGGVLLFDDYGWIGFEDTKLVVDEFLSDKPGMLMKWPTGQAMFIRSFTE
jgi:O-methyltransferase